MGRKVILLLLACTHTPAVLFPAPVRQLEIDDPPDDGPEPLVLDVGDAAPAVGLLVTPEDFARLKTRSRLLVTRTEALRVCYDHREEDRTRAQDAYSVCSLERHEALRREAGLRVAVPVAGVGGVALGLGLGAAYTWASSRAIGVGVSGAL